MMKTDEDRNVIGVLRGHSGSSESDGNVSEVLGAWLEFGDLVRAVSGSWRMVGTESGE